MRGTLESRVSINLDERPLFASTGAGRRAMQPTKRSKFAMMGVSHMQHRGPNIPYVDCHNEHGVYLGASALVMAGVADPRDSGGFSLLGSSCFGERFIRIMSTHCLILFEHCLEHCRNEGERYEAIIKEIDGLGSSFTTCNLVHESRRSNYEVHNLARHATTLDPGRHTSLGQL